MEKNISFSVYDVASSLVPGIAFLLIIFATQDTTSFTPEALVATLLSFGFIVGLLFLAFGNWLYNSYFHPNDYKSKRMFYLIILTLHKLTKFFVRENYALKGLDLREQITNELKKKYDIKEIDALGLFQLTDIISQKRGSGDRLDLLSKEGAFRSISAMIICSFFYLLVFTNLIDPLWVWLILFTFSLRLALYGHNYYKKIRQSQIYLATFTILREEAIK